jgi:hypothetical protein
VAEPITMVPRTTPTKPPAKRTTPTRTAAKKTTARTPAAKRTTARKTTAKKPAAKRTTARKTTAKKPAAKRTTARKTTAARVRYRVKPSPRGWEVSKQGAKRASGTFERKTDAVARGKELAKRPRRGQLVVHGQDGKIQGEFTYGEDPRRSKN